MIPLLLAVDYLNFTYRTNPCSGNVPVPVVMRKGSFSYEDKKMATSFDLFVRGVTRGSLRAGTHQAVVVITCDFPNGGTAAAYAFDERAAGAVPLGRVATGSWGSDWGAGPQSMTFRFANQRLIVGQCDDLHCNARRSTTYALRGAKLVALKVTRTMDSATAKRLRYEELLGRGADALNDKRYDAAIAACTEAIRLDPKSGAGWSFRGQAYLGKGQYDRAIADLSRAIAYSPFAEDLDARGRAYAGKRQYDRALQDIGAAVQQSNDARYLADRAQIYAATGDVDQARRDYDEAIRRFTADRQHDIATNTDMYRGHSDQIRSGLLAWYKRIPMATAYQSRGLLSYKAGRWPDAIADFDAAVALEPKLAVALYARGLAKRHDGQPGFAADLAAAARLQPNVATQLARAGIR